MLTEALTIRIDPEMSASLKAVAESQDRDKAWIVREALGAYLELHQWQVEHVKEGMRAADNGRFATAEQVRATVARLTGSDGSDAALCVKRSFRDVIIES